MAKKAVQQKPKPVSVPSEEAAREITVNRTPEEKLVDKVRDLWATVYECCDHVGRFSKNKFRNSIKYVEPEDGMHGYEMIDAAHAHLRLATHEIYKLLLYVDERSDELRAKRKAVGNAS